VGTASAEQLNYKCRFCIGNPIVLVFAEVCIAAAVSSACIVTGYEPDDATVALANAAGISSITVTNDRNAVKGADVIYTDVWASMGQKDTLEKKLRDFGPYQVRNFGVWGLGFRVPKP
jgi:ornithine carbamoyltransferase